MWWGRTQAYVQAVPSLEGRSHPRKPVEGRARAGRPAVGVPAIQHAAPAHPRRPSAATAPRVEPALAHQPRRQPPETDKVIPAEAVAFTTYATSQPSTLITLARTDAAARRSLLEGYGAFRTRAGTRREGDQQVTPIPSPYNAPPLPVTLASYPSIDPPLYAAATGVTTTFFANIRSRTWWRRSSSHSAAGRYRVGSAAGAGRRPGQPGDHVDPAGAAPRVGGRSGGPAPRHPVRRDRSRADRVDRPIDLRAGAARRQCRHAGQRQPRHGRSRDPHRAGHPGPDGPVQRVRCPVPRGGAPPHPAASRSQTHRRGPGRPVPPRSERGLDAGVRAATKGAGRGTPAVGGGGPQPGLRPVRGTPADAGSRAGLA